MSKWTQEFKYDLPSAFCISKETTPIYLRYLLTSKGCACPDFASGNSLEICAGTGVGLSIKTACQTSNWQGIELNPSLVNKALRRAKQCNIKLDLCSDDFAKFAQRDDLPKFDLICLHFAWSWISKEDQEIIINLVKDKLNEGGVFFISYNCTVGMTNFESVRDLMKLYDDTKHNNSVDDSSKIININKFLYPLIELNPAFVISQPDFAQRIQSAINMPQNFLSENVNTYWSMEHFSEIAERFEKADIDFVCSANGADNLDEINLSAEQLEFLKPLVGTSLYEECRDFMVNQRYRHDVFVKGAVALSTDEYLAELASQNIVMTINADNFGYKLSGVQGDVELPKELYQPLIEILSDNQSHNIGVLIDTVLESHSEIETSSLIQAINTLVFANICSVAVPTEQVTQDMLDQCLRLNLSILNSFNNQETVYLGSPLLQTAIAIDALDAQMLKIFVNTPNCTDLHIVEGVLQLCVSGVISIVQNVENVSDDEVIQATTRCAQAFLQNTVPLYAKLMMIQYQLNH